jgi:hypothetical protein
MEKLRCAVLDLSASLVLLLATRVHAQWNPLNPMTSVQE